MPISDGAGVQLRRFIGTPELSIYDPFLLLDVFHSEMPEQGHDLLRGTQLWVNLRGRLKIVDPAYQDIPADRFPDVVLGQGTMPTERSRLLQAHTAKRRARSTFITSTLSLQRAAASITRCPKRGTSSFLCGKAILRSATAVF